MSTNSSLIQSIKKNLSTNHHEKDQEIHWIKNIRAVNGNDLDAVRDEIADADLLATAVGASVLEKIAPIIAKV